MQVSIYYQEKDQYLLDKAAEMARRDRRSKSATILSILEEYFEAGKKVGRILKDMKAISTNQLQEALATQREEGQKRKIGEIMLAKGYVQEGQLIRALEVQIKQNEGGAKASPN
ncbi:hypothetical protein KGY77_07930 [Candidatus Bipolaricaulota bacterium]|nr:hypothetical protein [Candidatus Bipolaricaulota bacterium]